MLRSITDTQGYTIQATDGDIGTVHEFYFDDEYWTVRYLVVDTGQWFGPRVLVSPIAVQRIDPKARTVYVNLTREQVEHSPSTDLRRPVSRQYETRYYAYFGYGPYWGGPGAWGAGATPTALAGAHPAPAAEPTVGSPETAPYADEEDSHLHSTRDVLGYHIQAIDGDIGHIDDFFIDGGSWAIRYIQVDTSNWIGGKPVLVPQEVLDEVNWADAKIGVNVSRERIANSPEFDRSNFGAAEVRRLDDYYGRAAV